MQYIPGPFGVPPKLAMSGLPCYLFGSGTVDIAPTRMNISNSVEVLGTVTLTVTIVEGNIPVPGALISVVGTSNGSGAFNVTEESLTAVSINMATGVGTVSYSIGGSSNVASAADSGIAIAPQPEIGEELVNDVASIPVAAPFNDPKTSGSRVVDAVVLFPELPSAVEVYLQWAMTDDEYQYAFLTDINGDPLPVAVVTGGEITKFAQQFPYVSARFYRFYVANLSGFGSIIAKVTM